MTVAPLSAGWQDGIFACRNVFKSRCKDGCREAGLLTDFLRIFAYCQHDKRLYCRYVSKLASKHVSFTDESSTHDWREDLREESNCVQRRSSCSFKVVKSCRALPACRRSSISARQLNFGHKKTDLVSRLFCELHAGRAGRNEFLVTLRLYSGHFAPVNNLFASPVRETRIVGLSDFS